MSYKSCLVNDFIIESMNICHIAILLSVSLFLFIHILLSIYPFDSLSSDNINHITTQYNKSLQTLRLKFQSHITHGSDYILQVEKTEQTDSQLRNDVIFKNSSITSSSQLIKEATLTSTITSNNNRTKRVLIFTMDSIESYEKNSKAGGAAGTHYLNVIYILYVHFIDYNK